MNCLLDTCTFIWLATDHTRLSATALQTITNPSNHCFVSAVTAWEVAVKYSAGKLPLPQPPDVLIPHQRSVYRLLPLELTEADALNVLSLPALHRDPFDRLLVCQARTRQLTILTPDGHITQYPVPTLW